MVRKGQLELQNKDAEVDHTHHYTYENKIFLVPKWSVASLLERHIPPWSAGTHHSTDCVATCVVWNGQPSHETRKIVKLQTL